MTVRTRALPARLDELPEREGYTPLETARVIGVGAEKIRQMIRRGELPAARCGRTWRIGRKSLEAWLAGEALQPPAPKPVRPAAIEVVELPAH